MPDDVTPVVPADERATRRADRGDPRAFTSSEIIQALRVEPARLRAVLEALDLEWEERAEEWSEEARDASIYGPDGEHDKCMAALQATNQCINDLRAALASVPGQAVPTPEDDALCGRCGHTALWHANVGRGACQVHAGCACVEFIVTAATTDGEAAR